MSNVMKTALAVSALLGAASAAEAQTNVSGVVQAVYADPSDVVIQLDVVGPCGTAFYHVRRTNVNFNQMFEVARTAIATNKRLSVFVTATCQGTRNILSHAAILR